MMQEDEEYPGQYHVPDSHYKPGDRVRRKGDGAPMKLLERASSLEWKCQILSVEGYAATTYSPDRFYPDTTYVSQFIGIPECEEAWNAWEKARQPESKANPASLQEAFKAGWSSAPVATTRVSDMEAIRIGKVIDKSKVRK